MRTNKVRFVVLIALIVILAALPFAAGASHAWSTYHWARTSNPARITVVDSLTTDWKDNLVTANSDWNKSTVLENTIVQGDNSSNARKRCAAISGKVRVCNATYGNNGWLGLAQIWLSNGHISQGTAKMNDSYMGLASNYTETNRQHVMCQEVGHDWGLGHQSESGADLNTCMDYDNALGNPSPNAHDYTQLESIYAHLDSSTTILAAPAGFANADMHAQENWGEKISESADGRSAIFIRDFGNGFQIVTHVTWAP